MKKTLYLFICAAVVSNISLGQIFLTSEINPGTNNGFPCMLTPFNDKLYMQGRDATKGDELHAYENSGARPELVYDLMPGSSNGLKRCNPSSQLPVLDNKLYFSGNSDTKGFELMRIGTTGAPEAAGPEVFPGTSSSDPMHLINFDNKIFFTATHPDYGTELHAYNLATNTSAPVADIAPGASSSTPGMSVEYKGKLYFPAGNATTGRELYCYDPSTKIAALVQDIHVGFDNANPASLTVADGKLYFSANTLAYGTELYSYDGTDLKRCTDVNTGAANGVSIIGGYYKGKLFFSGNSGSGFQLFSYNVSTNTTTFERTINPTGDAYPNNFCVYGRKLYFAANDGVNGAELWVYDGSLATMVKDLEPGSNPSNPNDLIVWKGKLMFRATTSALGSELYQLTTSEGLGFGDVSFKGSVIIAPNPATTDTRLLLNLDVSQKLQISISDIIGKQLYHIPARKYESGSQEVTLPLSQYSTGTYFYTIADEQGKMLINGKVNKF